MVTCTALRGRDHQVSKRGIIEDEHAPQSLARARRVRTMRCGRLAALAANARSTRSQNRRSIAIRRSRLYSPTTSSPGWNAARLLAT